MAASNSPLSQNKQFLQQFERQRLNKPCNRIIDLRGRVAGECQAYTFGNKTHYLDDRGYLLARQLLEKFNGQYTMGVYESLLKALKTLKIQDNKQASVPVKIENDILFRDASQPQLIAFDHLLYRKEARILFATAVDLLIEDVLYHGATVDITSSAIRIALKRAYALDRGDQVAITFPELNESSATTLLSNIPYTVSKIEHDEQRTFAVLSRQLEEGQVVTDWFDNWIEQYNSPEYLDLDNELSNIISHYYLRLHLRSLTTPILWLSHSEANEAIKAFHLMPAAEQVCRSIENSDDHINLALLPINELLETGLDHLVVSVASQDGVTSLAVPRNDALLVAKAIKWYQQQEHSTILLLQIQQQKIETQHYTKQLEKISDRDKNHAALIEKQLSSISHSVTITDISNSCQNIFPSDLFSDDDIKRYTVNTATQDKIPSPSALQYNIQRREQRFYIRTEISAYINDEIYKVKTLDASANGLSFSLPTHQKLFIGMHVKVDFDRWQSQTTHDDVTNIPFVISNLRFFSGQTIIGLKRMSENCPRKVNQFFTSVIQRNKAKLAENHQDVFLSQESHIFSSLLSKSMTSIPLYFGPDLDNKRILQAVAETDCNHAKQLDALWLTLAQKVGLLSEICNSYASHSADSSTRFGLYCYQNKNNDEWVISTDFDFLQPEQKTLFISRALANQHYRFYQCSLQHIDPHTREDSDDLEQQLALLRNHSTHKVKQIREVLASLFGMGNLSDITDIITAAYR